MLTDQEKQIVKKALEDEGGWEVGYAKEPQDFQLTVIDGFAMKLAFIRIEDAFGIRGLCESVDIENPPQTFGEIFKKIDELREVQLAR